MMNNSFWTGWNPVKTRLDLQHGFVSPINFVRTQQVSYDLIQRLGLETELAGHNGCVNCLEWNSRGTHLASGSDDCNIILWDPFQHKKLTTMKTQHKGNIFSVKFLSTLNESLIVTGAADSRIRVHDIDQMETLHDFSCHTGRVKRLATTPSESYLFWSAAEDGTVRQFDLRDPESSTCKNPSNVLVNLNAYITDYGEAKCLAINPLRPNLLAVGCNDPYVRIFDRRKLSLTTALDAMANPTACERKSCDIDEADFVDYCIPGHLLCKSQGKRSRHINITYLAYSPSGEDLVVNMGSEQVYVFSNNQAKPSFSFSIPPGLTDDKKLDETDPCGDNGHRDGVTCGNGKTHSHLDGSFAKRFKRSKYEGMILPVAIEALKKLAYSHFESQRYSKAIEFYNEAIYKAPCYAVLYTSRAEAYLKRNWDGDAYAALLDCRTGLSLDPSYFKAHIQHVRCLLEFDLLDESKLCLDRLSIQFPDQVKCSSFLALEKSLEVKIAKKQRASKTSCPVEEHSSPVSSSSSSTSSPLSSAKTRPQLSPTARSWKSDGLPGSLPEGDLSEEIDASDNPDGAFSQMDFQKREEARKSRARDYSQRFCGHCNTTTDIKEANFFGSNGQYIVAGSDDGSFFIWDRKTTNIVRVLRGDDSIVNCLQPHPTCCLLATSGIDHVVRLWSPMPEEGYTEDREITDRDEAASANQRRMRTDPLEVMLMSMGYPFHQGRSRTGESGEENDEDDSSGHIPCRTS